MIRYWTADLHLGHYSKNGGIIAFANRPFRDKNHMNARLIANANEKVKSEDACVHVGDFCIRTNKVKSQEWQDQLQGHWVFLWGNHDKNNGTKTVGLSMFARISHFTVFVGHIPYFYEEWYDADFRNYIERKCDFAICGHVHNSWKYHLGVIPTINVGVDVWDYRPVSDDQLIALYGKLKGLKKKCKECGGWRQPIKGELPFKDDDQWVCSRCHPSVKEK